jgi:hypothetical protein
MDYERTILFNKPKFFLMDKIKVFQDKIPCSEIVTDLQMQQVKGGVEDKRNRPGVKKG